MPSGGNHESEICDLFPSCFDSVAFFRGDTAMEACSAKWADLKAAGKTKGQTWPEFWSQCSKDFAAKNGTEPAQPEKTTSKKAAAKTAAVDESDSSGSGQQKKDSEEKWGTYKTRLGAHGWHDYFQFMAKCM